MHTDPIRNRSMPGVDILRTLTALKRTQWGAPPRTHARCRLRRLWTPGVALAEWLRCAALRCAALRCAALRCAARLTWHDLGPGRTRHRHDPGRTRTCTCRFRRATPYPSGHRAKWKRSDQHSMVLGQHGKDSDHDCAQKAPRTAVGHGVVRLPCSILWHCVTGMLTAAHSSLFVGGRRCLLHVRRDRDAYALAFCSCGGRRLPPCVLGPE